MDISSSTELQDLLLKQNIEQVQYVTQFEWVRGLYLLKLFTSNEAHMSLFFLFVALSSMYFQYYTYFNSCASTIIRSNSFKDINIDIASYLSARRYVTRSTDVALKHVESHVKDLNLYLIETDTRIEECLAILDGQYYLSNDIIPLIAQTFDHFSGII